MARYSWTCCGGLLEAARICVLLKHCHRSDPTENDSITGLRPNARGPGLVTFGPDRVKEFLEANNLQACFTHSLCGACLPF